jgi:hypothetical protein
MELMYPEFNWSDLIGSLGVTLLLVAFLLNLRGILSRDGLPYILLNIIGAGMACLASWLIHYIPFVVLEGTWTLVSLFALLNYFKKKSDQ